MPDTFLKEWQNAFFQGLQSHEAAQPLREAALAGRLGDWTTCLTRAVVQSCKELGWVAAARGHLVDVLPVPRNEYLALDVMAFQSTTGNRWPFPVAVFELENSPDDDRVAYALWKLLSIRASLRVLFAYRWESAEGSVLAGYLAENVVGVCHCEAIRGVCQKPPGEGLVEVFGDNLIVGVENARDLGRIVGAIFVAHRSLLGVRCGNEPVEGVVRRMIDG